MEATVRFKGWTPSPRAVVVGMERDNKVFTLRFEELPAYPGGTAYLHIDFGSAGADSIEIVDGLAEITRNITQHEGEKTAYVEIIANNDVVWHSDRMLIYVNPLPLVDGKIEQAYPTAFEQALAQTAADKAAAAKSAADAAATAAGIVTEEKARKDAEGKRVAAETARENAEKTRAENERLRASAESERVKAEAARKTAEGKREKAEAAREQETAAAVKRADDLVKSVEAKLENGDFVGAQGPQGPQGPIGETGPQGIPGAQGEKGEKGDTGATGPQGVPGADGADGAPGKDGRDGLDAPQIDDTAITSTNPWSSAHIIDVLCPKASVSGNPVVVKDALGGVGLTECKASFIPTQAGTGTPSPDNIRPISGRDSVKVERCGENLLNITPFTKQIRGGITYEYVANGGVHISGTATTTVDSPTFAVGYLPPGKYYGLDMGTGVAASIVVQRNGRNLWLNAKGTFEILAGDVIKYWYMIASKDATLDKTIYPYIVPGTSAPAAYTPYTAQTTALTLPRTIYGGEVDAQTGGGKETWRLLTLTGQEKSHIFTTLFYLDLNAPGAYDYNTGTCSHYKYLTYGKGAIGVTAGGDNASVVYAPVEKYEISEDGLTAWKSYLAAQYAAGTPVQVAYKLATPVPFTATGGAEIKALDGVNTLLTGGDTISATYTQSPAILLKSLKAQASTQAASTAALERAVTDI